VVPLFGVDARQMSATPNRASWSPSPICARGCVPAAATWRSGTAGRRPRSSGSPRRPARGRCSGGGRWPRRTRRGCRRAWGRRAPSSRRRSLSPPPARGETAGWQQARGWLDGPLAGYVAGYDDLAGDRTSRLSAYLRFGCVSPLELADLTRFTGRPSTIEVRPGLDGRLCVGGPMAPVAAGRFHADLT
jgi:hypothetical protein